MNAPPGGQPARFGLMALLTLCAFGAWGLADEALVGFLVGRGHLGAACVERAVPVELEDRSAKRVRSRSRDGAHDAAGGTAELRAVAVRLHAELPDRVDAQQQAGQARGRLVGDVRDVGAVEQEAGLLRTPAAERQLRLPEAR